MNQKEQELTFKSLFFPFTTKKAIIFIIIIGFVVFFNSLFGSFVWDDRMFIQYNPGIHNLNIVFLLKASVFNNIDAGIYRFLQAFYFAILYAFFADNTFFYHLSGLGIHLLNAILLFYLFKRFFKTLPSFLLSLIFLIHPIQTESVSYIGGSGNNLFFLFGISALILSMQEKINQKKEILVFVLLLFSLLAKETGIIFICLVILSRFIFSNKNKFLYFIYTAITLSIYFFMRFYIAGVYFPMTQIAPIRRLQFLERIVNIPAVFFYYLKTFLFPLRLSIEQYWIVTKINLQNFYFPLFIDLLFAGAFIFTGIYIKKYNKKLLGLFLFFASWFIFGMLIYMQIFPLEMTVADRWFYFPLAGLLGIIGVIYLTFPFKYLKYKKFPKTISIALLILIFVLLSLRTIIRNSNWHDPIALYEHDSRTNDNFDIENSLGGELNLLGEHGEAFFHFQKSVAMFPHETNLFNLAQAYQQKGYIQNTQYYLVKALESKNLGQIAYPKSHMQITYEKAAGIFIKDNPQKALNITLMGIKDYPEDAQLWFDKGLCEYELGNYNNALVSINKAKTLSPDNKIINATYTSLINKKPIVTE